MVIDESLRMYPGAWGYERVAFDEDEVFGYHVPCGALVLIAPYTLHRNPRLWRDPHRFMPERFRPGAAELPHRLA